MTPRHSLGELEQMVLLAILRLGCDAFAPAVATELEERAERSLSRGALYATLDRLERKGLLAWEVEPPPEPGGGHRRRRFRLTPAGLAELASARDAWDRMTEGIEHLIRAHR